MPDEDRVRFERVFREHYDDVLRFALARADPELAREAAAETFLVAWRQLDQLPEVPRAWLLAVARRKVADQYRSRARRSALAERAAAAPTPPSVADPAEQVPERDAVRVAFGRLRAADQEVLRLVAWDGLSREEAAAVLGCGPALYAVRLHRARRRLRAALAAAEEEAPHPRPTRAPLVPAVVKENP